MNYPRPPEPPEWAAALLWLFFIIIALVGLTI